MTLPVPRRILVLGGGGREHALAWKLAREAGVEEVVVAPGSAGIAQEPGVETAHIPGIYADATVDLARSRRSDLVVVGPEAWLAAGVADALIEAGIPVFGPARAAARLETSKTFCHEVAQAAGVRMARAILCETSREIGAAVREIALAGRGFVIKDDGLAGGKGVTVCGPEVPPERWYDVFPGDTGEFAGAVVVEERLEGPEASVIAVCDGERAVALPAARDHKRLRDDDEGPNTGGMGAYSPLPDLGDAAVDGIVQAFHRPVLAELARRGTPFRGFLYAGLMLTSTGPVLLEFNARLGDPEAQVILPRLAGDLAPVLLAAAGDGLPDDLGSRLPVTPDSAVGVVLAGGRYPDAKSMGDSIAGLSTAQALGHVFHAGTRQRPDGSWETDGGRVLTVVGQGAELVDARQAAERAADAISWPDMQRRHDIAARPPLPVGASA